MKLFSFLAAGALLALISTAQAQTVPGADKPKEFEGTFTISPASAPAMMLEVVGASIASPAKVSINNPDKSDSQKWIFTAKGDGYYSISPAHAKNLAITTPVDNDKDGAPITVETNTGAPNQLWAVNKYEDGSVSLNPKSNLERTINNMGGSNVVGNAITLWRFFQHKNLQLILKPVE